MVVSEQVILSCFHLLYQVKIFHAEKKKCSAYKQKINFDGKGAKLHEHI